MEVYQGKSTGVSTLTRCPCHSKTSLLIPCGERLSRGRGELGLYFAAPVSFQSTGSRMNIFPTTLVHYIYFGMLSRGVNTSTPTP